MRIVIEDPLMIKLLAIANITAPQEFSGMGFCNIKGEDIVVYDFVLCNIGDTSYTEIPTELLLKLMERPDAKNMKVWLHRHPIGSGVPGNDNWSSTDVNTAVREPLGGIPELVRWSVAIVLTPHGFVGRIDNHIKHETKHLEVFPSLKDVYKSVEEIRREQHSQENYEIEDWRSVITRTEFFRNEIEAFSNNQLKKVGLTRRKLTDLLDAGRYDDIDDLLIYIEDGDKGMVQDILADMEKADARPRYIDNIFEEIQQVLDKSIHGRKV